MPQHIDRRSFVGILGGAGALPAAAFAQAGGEKKTRLYLMESFQLKAGNQLSRLHQYLEKSALPALGKIHEGPKIVLEALIAEHTPQVVMVLGFQSNEEFWSVRGKLNQDKELEKAFEAWQTGPEAPFESQNNALLEATDYSPEVLALDPPPKAPRIFELRVYHAPSWPHLKFLHERFSNSETKIFARAGVHPIFYTSCVIGPNMPNLTYMIPFEDLASREKAWNAFSADPEWVKVRQESIDQHGQMTENNQISLYRAAPYSPVR
jgi:hypothetical protein